MGELGDILRQAREALGLTLEQVESATKIRATYLQALEEDAFERMPAPVYVKGFLKNYAQFLGLDASEVLALYPQSEPSQTTSSIPRMLDRPLEPVSIRRWWPLALVPVVVAAAALSWWGYQRYAGAASSAEPTATPTSTLSDVTASPSPTLPSDTPTPAPTRTSAPTATITATPTSVGLEIGVEIVGSRSWLLVLADGERVFAGILEPGATQKWAAQERISLRSGNAGAVRLTVNGADVGLFGQPGQVLEREWTAPGIPTSTPTTSPTATAGT